MNTFVVVSSSDVELENRANVHTFVVVASSDLELENRV